MGVEHVLALAIGVAFAGFAAAILAHHRFTVMAEKLRVEAADLQRSNWALNDRIAKVSQDLTELAGLCGYRRFDPSALPSRAWDAKL